MIRGNGEDSNARFLAQKHKIPRDTFPLIKVEKRHLGQRGKVLLATDRTRGASGPMILRCVYKPPHTKRKVWARDVLRSNQDSGESKGRGAKDTLHRIYSFNGTWLPMPWVSGSVTVVSLSASEDWDRLAHRYPVLISALQKAF